MKLRKEEKKLIGFEFLLVSIMAALVVWSVLEILDGSLIAVILCVLPALGMCLLLEDIDRIKAHAKRREQEHGIEFED